MRKTDREPGSRRALLATVLTGACGLFGWTGCQPTPDYRLTVHDIPEDAAVLLIGWKSDGDMVTKRSLAVPVAQLGPEERASYVIGLDIAEAPEEGGVVSIATIDKDLCLTSVLSAASAPRSSPTSVTMIDLELDPTVNAEVVQRAKLPNPPIDCPSQQLPFPPPVACAKVPGLGSVPAEPTFVQTRPVVMSTLRQLRGPARVFDGGKLSFYGWGFDRATLTFGIPCDPTQCFVNLALKYPQYAAQMSMQMSFRYPSLSLVGYSQLELLVTQVKSAFNVDPSSGFQDGVVLCLAVSASSFSLANPDGASTYFSEPLLKM